MRSKAIPELAGLALALLFSCSPSNKEARLLLPVMGEKKVAAGDTVYHQLSNFSLLNQYGDSVSLATINGKLVVANFFFASCQSICPQMSSNLIKVQEAFPNADSLLIISHSVNPLHDTVEVLNAYAKRYGAKKGQWHLLTGDKKQIYELAKTSYLVNALEDDGSPEGFLHSELFLLIDTQGRIRGMYDGTYMPEVERLIKDIKLLKTEKPS